MAGFEVVAIVCGLGLLSLARLPPERVLIYAWNPLELPFRVFRVELATGGREPWKTIAPQDPAGIWSADLMLTPDGKSYAYNCKRVLNDLYLVEGLK